jgi:anti-anti-sigma factor
MQPEVLPGLSVESCPPVRGVHVVAVGGTLGFETVAEFRRRLDRAGPRHSERLVLDLSALHFIDSSGLAELVLLLEHTEAADGRLAIASDQAQVTRAFETTGLAAILGLVTSREQGIDALAERT